ncbi:MAG: hypothetical protein JWL75_570 [Parcubacteria group bacterium]|nr:hypothetical protein [Parcubacteria group bacterium]
MTEKEILDTIRSDSERMSILKAVSELKLSDWWIGAGFVRSAVWDHLFAKGNHTKLNDVDVVYWKSLDSYGIPEETLISVLKKDEANPVWDEERFYQEKLSSFVPGYEFEVKNQARMHLWSGKLIEREPYLTAAEGIADWVETATTVGVRLNEGGELIFTAPNGILDLVNGIIRPRKKELTEVTLERTAKKNWLTQWPGLHFEDAI